MTKGFYYCFASLVFVLTTTPIQTPQESISPRLPVTTDAQCPSAAQQVVNLLRIDYPLEALRSGTDGSVDIEITTDSSGKVTDARGISGLPIFVDAAVKAARYWSVPLIDGLHEPLSLKVHADFAVVPDQPVGAEFPEVTDLSVVTIKMERQGCYGKCPVYNLSIDGNGLVEYDGTSYVHTKGKHETRITPDQVKQLLEDFRGVNYFALQDEYSGLRKSSEITVSAGGCSNTRRGTTTSTSTDLPSTLTTLTIGNRTKRVWESDGAPPTLRKLEVEIDEISHSGRWVVGR